MGVYLVIALGTFLQPFCVSDQLNWNTPHKGRNNCGVCNAGLLFIQIRTPCQCPHPLRVAKYDIRKFPPVLPFFFLADCEMSQVNTEEELDLSTNTGQYNQQSLPNSEVISVLQFIAIFELTPAKGFP